MTIISNLISKLNEKNSDDKHPKGVYHKKKYDELWSVATTSQTVGPLVLVLGVIHGQVVILQKYHNQESADKFIEANRIKEVK